MKNYLLFLLVVGSFFYLASTVSAHQSGCHRWHSCPSDTGSYICGDLGYTSGCSDYSPTYYDYTYPSTPTCPLNSYYDGISSCKCNYGYVVSGDSCVSADSLCYDQLGYNSSYDSLTDTCKCDYGYVISGGQCTYGNTVCHVKFGLYSSYNSSSNKCECDSGYTLDSSNQCVKKQNNVYFKLLDVNTDDRQAIIKSEYDSRKYLITYGYGCYSSSMQRAKNGQIVVNLGTDFELDIWDKIVLQDDSEVCDITRRERTYEDKLAVEEEEESYSYVLPTPVPVTKPTSLQSTNPIEFCVQKLGSNGIVTGQNSCGCAAGYVLNESQNSCVPIPVSKPSEEPVKMQASTKPIATKESQQKTAAVVLAASTSTLDVSSTMPTSTPNTPFPNKSIWQKILDWFKWW